MLSRGQGKSRKTFSRPAGLSDTFSILGPNFCFYAGLVRTFSRLRPGLLFPSGIMSTFFHSFRVWHALFLLWDPIFASIRVWFALFLFSDPGCSSLLALCQPFSILYGSGTRFFSSGTSPFPSISPGFQFV